MGQYLLLIVLLCFLLPPAQAQALIKLHETPIPGVRKVSTDKSQNIYISGPKGNIFKYDKNGKLVHRFSPQKPGTVSLMEGRQTTTLFAFFEDSQECLILDRFLIPSGRFTLEDPAIGFAGLAAPGSDNKIWIFDEADFSLKKYDYKLRKVLIKTPFTLTLPPGEYHFNFMKEYHNLLFVNDKSSGILIFDNSGNYLKKLPCKNLEYFNFYKNEIYFLSEDKIHFFNFSHFSKERTLPLPAEKHYQFALVFEEKLVLISPCALDIFKLNP